MQVLGIDTVLDQPMSSRVVLACQSSDVDSAYLWMSSMKKSFKNLKSEDLELLVARQSTSRAVKNPMSGSVKIHIFLLVASVSGLIIWLWAMFQTSHSRHLLSGVGMKKVANSLDNILELLAYPVLMFLVILAIYASQRLLKAYSLASRPDKRRS